MTKKRQVSELVQTRARKWDCLLGRLATRLQCYIKIADMLNVQDIIVFVFSNKKKISLLLRTVHKLAGLFGSAPRHNSHCNAASVASR